MRTYGNGSPVFLTEEEDGYSNSPEFVAAMYESAAADDEMTELADTSRNPAATAHNKSLSAYARAAHRLCEEIEIWEYENTCPYCDRLSPTEEAHEYHMGLCAPMDRY